MYWDIRYTIAKGHIDPNSTLVCIMNNKKNYVAVTNFTQNYNWRMTNKVLKLC
jgi:hypothetical protein